VTDVVPRETAQMSYFESLIQDAARIDSGILIKGDDLARLENVPFVVTGANYREGDIADQGSDLPGCYLSLQLTIADERFLSKLERMGRIKMDDLPFLPEETVIINDGSTGVKRQFTEYLHVQNHITVVAPGEELISGGAKGESSFDRPPAQWHTTDDRGRLTVAESGFVEYEIQLSKALLCTRGLRSSEYANKWTKEGRTWYLA
jgi:hypothetical protein